MILVWTFSHLNNGLPVASKLANTSRSVRNRRNSIREIHGPVPRLLSEIDGLRSRSRRGQLPWYSVLSLSCCHSCLGGVTPAKSAASRSPRQPRPTAIISFNASREWKFLQLAEGWLMAVVNQCWKCCVGFYSWGKWCRLYTTLPNPLCFFSPLYYSRFFTFQNKCAIETKLTMCITCGKAL